jgi:hypothetical protein
MTTVTVETTEQSFPAGQTFGGYSIVFTGATLGAQSAIVLPPGTTSESVTLRPDTWTATMTTIDANGEMLPGTSTVSSNSIVVGPTSPPVQIAVGTGLTLS